VEAGAKSRGQVPTVMRGLLFGGPAAHLFTAMTYAASSPFQP